ncbi:hypothetical protein K220099C10_19290 [Bacteroides thetaiotaomicron]
MGISIVPLSAKEVPMLKVMVIVDPDLLKTHPAIVGRVPITGVTTVFPLSAEIMVDVFTSVCIFPSLSVDMTQLCLDDLIVYPSLPFTPDCPLLDFAHTNDKLYVIPFIMTGIIITPLSARFVVLANMENVILL